MSSGSRSGAKKREWMAAAGSTVSSETAEAAQTPVLRRAGRWHGGCEQAEGAAGGGRWRASGRPLRGPPGVGDLGDLGEAVLAAGVGTRVAIQGGAE